LVIVNYVYGGVTQLVTRPYRTSVRSGGERLFKNMYVVYVLRDNRSQLYKGMTNNLARRIAEHRRGKTKTTSRMNNLMGA